MVGTFRALTVVIGAGSQGGRSGRNTQVSSRCGDARCVMEVFSNNTSLQASKASGVGDTRQCQCHHRLGGFMTFRDLHSQRLRHRFARPCAEKKARKQGSR